MLGNEPLFCNCCETYEGKNQAAEYHCEDEVIIEAAGMSKDEANNWSRETANQRNTHLKVTQ